MKSGIHPEYTASVIKCACGAVVETHSIKSEINVDICSKCHPFYSGKQKLVDIGGVIDRFNNRRNAARAK